MRTLLVTAADEKFRPLLGGLLRSLHQWNTQPFTDVAVFDVGLTPQGHAAVAASGVQVVRPGWDLPVNEKARAALPAIRALTVRPYLPQYFPGYDIYLWIDADAWVQERFAIEMYVAAAARGGLAVAPQTHVAYVHSPALVQWRRDRLTRYFGEAAANALPWENYVNAGVFALPADAPHWALWAKWFNRGLQATGGTLFCDQTALNHALWTERLAVSHLPARCNWLCHLALPRFDAARGKFFEPTADGSLLGILHLTANTKNHGVSRGADNAPDQVSLRFGAARNVHMHHAPVTPN